MTKTDLKSAISTIQNQCKELEMYIAIDSNDIWVYYYEDFSYKCKIGDIDKLIDAIKFIHGFKND